MEFGRAIARHCEALLDAWEGLDEDSQRPARATVEYFLLCRDGDDDLATLEGFDDHAAVFAAVPKRLAV